MKDHIELGWLYDFYGPLLSDKQQRYFSLWCEEDMSLTEIAEMENVSKQAVSDSLNTAEQRLLKYEFQLGLLARYRKITGELKNCLQELSGELTPREQMVKKALLDLLSEEEM